MVDIDEVVRYWDSRPCNIRHSNEAIGTRKYFDEVSAKKYYVEPHIVNFADFQKWSGKKVLEVGCGIGTAAQTFAENGAIYDGIDISSRAIELAIQRFKVFNLQGKFIVQNCETMQGESVYDLVYSFGVLHHTPNIHVAIKNIWSALKPGGTFKLMLYSKHSWKSMRIAEGLDQPEAQAGCPIANTYMHDDVYKLLKNFNNVQIFQAHIFPYKINEYKSHRYIKEDYFECMSPELFTCMEKHLGWHLCITCTK